MIDPAVTPSAGQPISAQPAAKTAVPMAGENIVCFAKDWNGDPTSVTHVMQQLARTNKVLWLNSIATRTPNLSKKGDLSRIAAKLLSFAQGPRRIHDNLWVYTPIVLPLPHNPIATALNRRILRLSVGMLRRKLKMKEFQLWAWPPTAAEYVDVLGQALTVYYCADAWPEFSSVDTQKMAALDDYLSKRADIVFATGHALTAEKLRVNPNTYLATHGVSYQQFLKALDPNLETPADIADCKQPIIGFYGLVEDWMDQDLLATLAEKHPEWTIVLIGKVCVDVSRLEQHANIRILGQKPHSELPAYCKQFAVGILPHKINALTLHMNPIKLREYMSAGLPVVSTALPEVQQYGSLCAATDSYDAFEQAIISAIQNDSPEQRQLRSAQMSTETWEHKVQQLMTVVIKVRSKQHQKPPTQVK